MFLNLAKILSILLTLLLPLTLTISLLLGSDIFKINTLNDSIVFQIDLSSAAILLKL